SCLASATRRTIDATTVVPNAATSALRADSARRRRRSRAATIPPTAAYSTRPRVTRRAARPSAATSGLRGRAGGRVLRGALRHERPRRGGEDAVPVGARDGDVAPRAEQVRDAAVVDDEHLGRSLHVAELEAQSARGVLVADGLPDHTAHERHRAVVVAELA